MAAPSGQFKPSRYFIALGIILAVLYGAVFAFGSSAKPKLGLDLQGGTSMRLAANTIAGKKPTSSNLDIARDIISQRVDSLGVSEANVVVQGTDIVVSVAGKADPKRLEQLTAQAKMEFRMVTGTTADSPPVTATPSASASPSASATPKPSTSPSAPAPSKSPAIAPKPSASASAPATAPSGSASPGSASPSAAPSASASPSAAPAPDVAAKGDGITPLADVKKKIGADLYATAAALTAPPTDAATLAELAPFSTKLSSADVAALPPSMQFNVPTITCEQLNGRLAGVITTESAINSQVVACDTGKDAHTKYLLDVAKVHGEDIGSASSTYDTTQGQGWIVNVSFKGKGQSAWAKLTSDAFAASQADGTKRSVAIVLDNEVVTAPTIDAAIPGPTTISGGFTQDSAKLLSTQLKFGSLPVSFTQLETDSVSPTLGLTQLKAGLLAGGIGLVLVIAYCLFYYRALGLVVIASLAVSASLIYGVIVLLGRSQLDFTLSLAGIAGFIVAIGITADSFVVFFERLKDEVREGRSPRSSVPRAWSRARRTILSADTVSLIAAVVLIWIATGPVAGFAFTLGVSTAIDLVVVFLFTHPLVSVLSGSKTFTSPRFSGLGELRKSRSTDAAAPARVGTMRTKES